MGEAEWTLFQPAVIPHTGIAEVDDNLCWLNSRYQVNVRYLEPEKPEYPSLAHLSIKRIDKAPIRDWRELQRIKNELAGTTCEAVELFPAESRLVDTSNQYHLWVLEPGKSFGIGWHEKRLADCDQKFEDAMRESAELLGMTKERLNEINMNSRQRAWELHHTTDGCPEIGPIWTDPRRRR
jgi:hypothetical protein